ncbi:hypothetical protein GYMLUDRAFT_981877 [Collybiopsis luxurians FD-317 M1]|nr:hypothetical protein GYMLUDRAFT_981877 [Collybiopsis luxurians FD-317 M1]
MKKSLADRYPRAWGKKSSVADDSGDITRNQGQFTTIIHGTGEDKDELRRLMAATSRDRVDLLKICYLASTSVANAQETADLLQRELRSGSPPSQLSALNLWAYMLRNASDIFISQCTSTRFIETLTVIGNNSLSQKKSVTSPVVRDRLMEILAAAVYASGTETGSTFSEPVQAVFESLWKKLNPTGKPKKLSPLSLATQYETSHQAFAGGFSDSDASPQYPPPPPPYSISISAEVQAPSESLSQDQAHTSSLFAGQGVLAPVRATHFTEFNSVTTVNDERRRISGPGTKPEYAEDYGIGKNWGGVVAARREERTARKSSLDQRR